MDLLLEYYLIFQQQKKKISIMTFKNDFSIFIQRNKIGSFVTPKIISLSLTYTQSRY